MRLSVLIALTLVGLAGGTFILWPESRAPIPGPGPRPSRKAPAGVTSGSKARPGKAKAPPSEAKAPPGKARATVASADGRSKPEGGKVPARPRQARSDKPAAAKGTPGGRAAAPGREEALTTEEVVARCEGSVALVKGCKGSGSGFLVRPGLLATNYHVITAEKIEDLRVSFPSATPDRREPMGVELVAEDPNRDLALLAVKTELEPLEVAASHRFRKGQDVTVIGSPGTGGGVLANAVTRGVMSIPVKIDDQEFYQLSIPVNPGNSGGPVLDARGRVVGVVTLKASGQESLGFCIPPADLASAIDRAGPAPADADGAAATHRARFVAAEVAVLGMFYGALLERLAGGTDRAPAPAKAPFDGFGELREVAGKGLAGLDVLLRKEIYPDVTRLAADERFDLAVRTDLTAAWDNCIDMQKVLYRPAGPMARHRSRIEELKGRHQRLVEKLRVGLLDVPYPPPPPDGPEPEAEAVSRRTARRPGA